MYESFYSRKCPIRHKKTSPFMRKKGFTWIICRSTPFSSRELVVNCLLETPTLKVGMGETSFESKGRRSVHFPFGDEFRPVTEDEGEGRREIRRDYVRIYRGGHTRPLTGRGEVRVVFPCATRSRRIHCHSNYINLPF